MCLVDMLTAKVDGKIEFLQAFGEQWVEESHVSQPKQARWRWISQPIARKTGPSETQKPSVHLFACSPAIRHRPQAVTSRQASRPCRSQARRTGRKHVLPYSRRPSLHHKCREIAGMLGRVEGGEVSAGMLAGQPAVSDKRGAGQFSATFEHLDKLTKPAARLHEDFRARKVEHLIDVLDTRG